MSLFQLRIIPHALLLIVVPVFSLEAQTEVKDDSVENASKKDQTKVVKLVDVTLAEGKLKLKVPETWKSKKPAFRMIQREFAIPSAKKDDEQAGRLTIVESGGTLAQNVDRWFKQFSQPNGKPTKDVAKVTEKKINGQKVTLVDISGTFIETVGGGGPFSGGKKVERPDYRMLGAIAQTKAGQYFFKLYGSQKTIAGAEKQFKAMIESLAPAEVDK